MTNVAEIIDPSFLRYKSRLNNIKNSIRTKTYRVLLSLVLKLEYRKQVINDILTYDDFVVAESLVNRNKRLISKPLLNIPDEKLVNRPIVSLEEFAKMADEAEVQLPPEKIAHAQQIAEHVQ